MKHAAPASSSSPDIALAGGGIIGLSLGLELLQHGLSVLLIERGQPMSAASRAAGGMLAVHDPQNPPALMPLALLSRELYPGYLARIESLSGIPVPLRTRQALQHGAVSPPAGRLATPADLAHLVPGLHPSALAFTLLEEASLDPRDLCAALPAAFLAAGGRLLEHTELREVESRPEGVVLHTSSGPISAPIFVDCRGAWAGSLPGLPTLPVAPVKGHMASLRCPPHQLRCALRAPDFYVIPRGDGRLALGSTLEHAGFDQRVDPATIARLVDSARRLLPKSELSEPTDIWTGLRPGTPDGLPILGPSIQPHCWHATGHYRDGILLAPATARVLAQAIAGQTTDVPLQPFAPTRFF